MNSHQDRVTLSSLSKPQKEDKDLSAFLRTLNEGDPKNIDDMIHKIASLDESKLYAYSEHSPELNLLLETNPYLNSCWSQKLKEHNYPDQPIVSVDKKMTLSPFSQLKGAYLLGILGEEPNLENPDTFEILNKACQIGMHAALALRLAFYVNKIKTEKDPDIIETYIGIIQKDAEKIRNLYWALGCIDAANSLLFVGSYYFQPGNPYVDRFFSPETINTFSWFKSYDTSPHPIRIVERAIENFYLAKLVEDLPQSKMISDPLTKGEGILAGLNVTNGNDLETFVLEALTQFQIPLISSFCQNAHDHALNRLHPDFRPAETANISSAK